MKRLHPFSAAHLLWKGALLGFGAPIFLTGLSSLFLSVDQVAFLIDLSFVLLFIGPIYALARYLCFKYDCRDNSLVINSGVFAKTEREIPYSRVQNVHVQQEVISRILGIATVMIETAGETTSEVTLGYISMEEAEQLQQTIRNEGNENHDSQTSPTHLFSLRRPEFFFLCVTSFLPGTIVLGIISLPAIIDQFGTEFLRLVQPLGGPERLALKYIDTKGVFAMVVVWGSLALITLWACSAVLTSLQYYGHILGRQNRSLVYKRGMISTRSGTIPYKKVQTIRISESIPLRCARMAKLSAETASAGGTGDAERQGRELIIPIAQWTRVWRFAHGLFEFDDPELERPPKRARARYAVQYIFVISLALVVAVATAVTTGFDYWYVPSVLVPLAPVAAHVKWTNRGYSVGDNCLIVQSGFWNRTTRIVPYFRFQSGSVKQTVLQRRWNLANFTFDTASTTSVFDHPPTVFDIGPHEARCIHAACRSHLQRRLSEPGSERYDMKMEPDE